MKFFTSTSTAVEKESPETASDKESHLTTLASNSTALDRTNSEVAIAKSPASNWSPALDRLLEEPSPTFPQHLTLGAIAFCLAFGTWSWFGTVDEVSKAQGQLIPQGETYKIEPVELGKVRYIAVKEGDKVKAGQTLIEFDTELTQQEVTRLKQMLQAYQTELDKKQTLREQLKLEAETKDNIAQAEASAQRAKISLAEEKAITYRQLLAQQQSEAKAYSNRQNTLELLPTLAREHSNQLNAEKASRQQRLAKLLPLAEKGAISQEYIFQAEQSLREIERQITQSQLQEMNNAKEQIFQSDRAIGDLQALMTNSQGELASTLKEIERLEAEFIQQQAESTKTQLEVRQKIEQLELELAQIKSKIADTQNLLSSATVKLQQKSLKAPVDGTVLSLNVDNSGKVVRAGETVVEIAPEGVPLILSAFLPNKEAGFIEEGMPAQIKLDAYPYQYYGLIPGTVTYLSADAKLDPQLGEVYQIEVELARNYVTEDRQSVEFQAGQTATADIVIRRRRLLDVWLEPIRKLQRDGIEM